MNMGGDAITDCARGRALLLLVLLSTNRIVAQTRITGNGVSVLWPHSFP